MSLAHRHSVPFPNTWIATHDDRWLFTLLYVGLAVILSLWISLFWLAAVVVGHGVLEWFALRQRAVKEHLLGHVLWHVKLDIGLVLFALCLGVYMEVILGAAGLNAVARTGAKAGARFITWQHAIKGLLLTIDDVAQVARAIVAKNGHGGNAAEEPIFRPWRQPWKTGDWVGIAIIVTFASLILLAPLLTEHTVQTTLQILAHDLHPWP